MDEHFTSEAPTDLEPGTFVTTQIIYPKPIFYSPENPVIGGALLKMIQMHRLIPFFSIAFSPPITQHHLHTQHQRFDLLMAQLPFMHLSDEKWRQMQVVAQYLFDRHTGEGHYANCSSVVQAVMLPQTKGQLTVNTRALLIVQQQLAQQAVAHLS